MQAKPGKESLLDPVELPVARRGGQRNRVQIVKNDFTPLQRCIRSLAIYPQAGSRNLLQLIEYGVSPALLGMTIFLELGRQGAPSLCPHRQRQFAAPVY